MLSGQAGQAVLGKQPTAGVRAVDAIEEAETRERIRVTSRALPSEDNLYVASPGPGRAGPIQHHAEYGVSSPRSGYRTTHARHPA